MNIVKNIQDINKKSIISATAFWLYGKLCGKINNSNNDIERKYKIMKIVWKNK